MHDIVCEAKTLSDACARLVSVANERGGEDNVTVVLARFDGAGLPARGSEPTRRIHVEHL
jgi:protein phosphatase